MTDLVYVPPNVLEQITFTDLLMINIENNFNVVAIHFINNLKGLVTANEIISGMVHSFIEWFNDQGNARLLKDWSNLS